MKDRYVNSTLANIDNQTNTIKSRKGLITAITVLGLSLLVPGTLLTMGFSVAAFTSFLAVTGAVGLAQYKNIAMKNDMLDRLKNEKIHLNVIKDNIPQATTDLNRRRAAKIRSLDNDINRRNNNYSIASVFSKTTLGVIGLGAIGSFIHPAFSVVTLLGLGTHAICSKVMVDQTRKAQISLNRKNNIINDVNVIINNDRDLQAQRIHTRRQPQNTNQNGNQNQNVNQNQQGQTQNQQPRPLPNRPQQTQQPVQPQQTQQQTPGFRVVHQQPVQPQQPIYQQPVQQQSIYRQPHFQPIQQPNPNILNQQVQPVQQPTQQRQAVYSSFIDRYLSRLERFGEVYFGRQR